MPKNAFINHVQTETSKQTCNDPNLFAIQVPHDTALKLQHLLHERSNEVHKVNTEGYETE